MLHVNEHVINLPSIKITSLNRPLERRGAMSSPNLCSNRRQSRPFTASPSPVACNQEEEDRQEGGEPSQPFSVPYQFPSFRAAPIKTRSSQRPEYTIKTVNERLPSRKEIRRLVKPVKTQTNVQQFANAGSTLNLGVNAGSHAKAAIGPQCLRSASMVKFETIGL